MLYTTASVLLNDILSMVNKFASNLFISITSLKNNMGNLN